MKYPEQGDIIRIANIDYHMFVASNDFFNHSGAVLCCPILADTNDGPLHIFIESKKVNGYVCCEQLRYFDLSKRSFRIVSRSSYFDTINIADAVQSIFDYH